MEIVTHVLTNPQAGLLPDNNDSQEIKTAKETRRRVARENIGINVGEGDIAAKSDMSVVPGTGADADKTTITLKPGTQATVLTQHQDISMKADSATTLAGYGITDAYTKTEVDQEIGKVGGFRIATATLDGKPDVPLAERSTKYIYLVKIDGATPPDLYNEWIWIEETGNSRWEQIGTTTFELDISKSIYQIPDEYESVLIGNRKYKIVTIGNQQWMAENLDYAWDGLTINASGSGSEPLAYYYSRGSKDTYGIDGTYKCGLLYNHPAVVYLHNNMGTLLPAGWDVPTENDWLTLLDAVGGASAALSKLKAKPASVSAGYPPQAWGGTDDYEFNILPVGFMDNNLTPAGLNNRTMLWTLDSDGAANRRCIDFDTNTSSVGFGSFNLLYDLSVRLVKNITTGA